MTAPSLADIPTEQALLGGVLLDPSSLDDLADILVPDDFGGSRHPPVWAAMLALHGRGETVDVPDDARQVEPLEQKPLVEMCPIDQVFRQPQHQFLPQVLVLSRDPLYVGIVPGYGLLDRHLARSWGSTGNHDNPAGRSGHSPPRSPFKSHIVYHLQNPCRSVFSTEQ